MNHSVLLLAVVLLLGTVGTVSEAATLGYWRFEEGVGLIAADSSGNGRTGTLFGGATFRDSCASAVPSPNNFGLHIDGAGGVLVPAPLAPRPETAITIETFFKLEPDAWVLLGMQLGVDPWYHNSYQVEFDRFVPGRVSFRLWDLASGPHEVIGSCGGDGQLHHLAGTWDGQTMRLYCDCEEVASAPFLGRISYVDERPLLIGGDSDVVEGVPSCCYFQGCIDEVRISDRALAPGELMPCGVTQSTATTWGRIKTLYH